jgi:hypothetical protein
MLGRRHEAIEHAEDSVATFERLGIPEGVTLARGDMGWVRELTGEPAIAERDVRHAIADAEALGNRELVSWAAARLLSLLTGSGRYDEAEKIAELAEEVPLVMNRTRALGARARIAAVRGEPSAPELVERLHREIAVLGFPNVQIEGLVDASLASASLGDISTAIRDAEDALALAEAKGNVARAAQLRQLLAKVRAGVAESSPA